MRFLLTIVLACSVFCSAAQEVELIKIEQLEELISEEKEALTVVNFWSTWCVPCIKELPYFNELESLYPEANINLILVSLDFSENLESKVVPLLKKKGITRKSYLLDETDPNVWMEKVDAEWKGSIPATLIIQESTKKRAFHEGSFTRETLKEALFN